MKCRATMELVGIARDRRALVHVEEVLREPNCKVLMCFICITKHLYYHGIDKYGNEYNAGRIDFRNSVEEFPIVQHLQMIVLL